MKKIIFSILITVMAVGLFGCSKGSKTEDESTKTDAVTEAVTEETTTEESETKDEVLGGNEVEEVKPDGDETLGNTLLKIFDEEIKKGTDLEEIANLMVAVPEFMCGAMEVEEGFLNGFKEELKGFNKGYTVNPMIGTIPFVAYIFETDDVEALEKSINDLADPRWNICTEAEETVIKTEGNVVFFAMCPAAEK